MNMFRTLAAVGFMTIVISISSLSIASSTAVNGPINAGCAPAFPGPLKDDVVYNFEFDRENNYLIICFDAGFKFSGSYKDLVQRYNSEFNKCFDLSLTGSNQIQVNPGPDLCFNPSKKNFYCPHNQAAFEPFSAQCKKIISEEKP